MPLCLISLWARVQHMRVTVTSRRQQAGLCCTTCADAPCTTRDTKSRCSTSLWDMNQGNWKVIKFYWIYLMPEMTRYQKWQVITRHTYHVYIRRCHPLQLLMHSVHCIPPSIETPRSSLTRSFTHRDSDQTPIPHHWCYIWWHRKRLDVWQWQ